MSQSPIVAGSIGHFRSMAYGVGTVAVTAFVVTPQLLLLFFLTEVHAVPPAWAGVAAIMPKLWECVFDPWIGHRSDRMRGRLGRRWGFMAAGTIAFPVSFVTLFSPPQFEHWEMSLAWVTVAFTLCTSAYSIFTIPFVTLPGEMSPHPSDRTRVVAWRMVFVGVGILVAGGLAPVVVEKLGGGRSGFAGMGLAQALLSAVVFTIATTAAWKFRLNVIPDVPTQGILQAIARIAGNRTYLWLWLSYFVQMIALAISSALMPYIAVHVLKAGAAAVAPMFVALTVGTILAMPLWVRLSARLTPINAYAAAIMGCAACSLLLMSSILGSLTIVCVGTFLFGFGQAGQQLMPMSLLPAALEHENRDTGIQHAGLQVAIWVAGEKLGMATGGFLTGFFLSAIGYAEGGGEQAQETIAAIPWLFALLPAAIILLSLWPMWHLKKRAAGLGTSITM